MRRGHVDRGERRGARRCPFLDQQLDQADHEDQLGVLELLGFALDALDLVPKVEQVRRSRLDPMRPLAALAASGPPSQQTTIRLGRSPAKATETG
jgi:hypothetical protein